MKTIKEFDYDLWAVDVEGKKQYFCRVKATGEECEISIPAKTDVWERFTITKTHYPDRMALIRVGDFYELLDQDAVEASDALELTLTGRSVPDKPTRVPMCGFPYHTLDKYLQKLQDKGFKVVIAEEDKEFAIKEKPKANQNYSDVEIAEIIPADGKEILRLYEYRFSDDRFYVDEEKGEVTWLYFNPDSTAGGQFVENVVSIEQILALKENEDYSVFFDKLGSEARQYLIDVGDENFHDVAKRFLIDEYYYHGFGTEAREEIISIAEQLEQVEKPRLKGEFTHRFSLRRLPFEGGTQAIFDNAIEAFEKRKQGCEFQLEELHKQVENAKAEIAKPFPRESELDEKCKRLAELNAELNMDRRENEIVDGADEQSEEEQEEKRKTRDDRDDR